METPGEPGSARRRPRGSRAVKATVAASAGVLLTGGLSMVPAAASAGHGKAPAVRESGMPTAKGKRVPLGTLGHLMLAPGIEAPQTTTPVSCSTSNYSNSVWGYCSNGSSGESFRVVAYCTNQEIVVGWIRPDGTIQGDIDNCAQVAGSTIYTGTPEPNSWGYLECSADNGNAAYDGYYPVSGDISSPIEYVGSLEGGTGANDLSTGGLYLCNHDISQEFPFAGGANP
jgi:hypothetical protein